MPRSLRRGRAAKVRSQNLTAGRHVLKADDRDRQQLSNFAFFNLQPSRALFASFKPGALG